MAIPQYTRRRRRPILSLSNFTVLTIIYCIISFHNFGVSSFIQQKIHTNLPPITNYNNIKHIINYNNIKQSTTTTTTTTLYELPVTDEAGSYDPTASYVTESEVATAANDLLLNSKQQVIDLPDEVSNSFMQYALSIILGRALPDARDGMKPVHRRILYAMNGLGLNPNSSYRKCGKLCHILLISRYTYHNMSKDRLSNTLSIISLSQHVLLGKYWESTIHTVIMQYMMHWFDWHSHSQRIYH